MKDFIIEESQKIPIYDETDVLVVGGGPAGYCAAISAARNGAKVTLMERYGYLGGMATGGYVLLIDCLCDGSGKLIIKGLVEETIERLRKVDGIIEQKPEVWGSDNMDDILLWRRWGATGGEDKIVRYSPVIDPEMMKVVCNEMVKEAGVKFLLHSWFSKAYVVDNVVKGAIFESKSGRQAVIAKQVIDCTGDGDVFASAGQSFRIGNLPLGLVFRVGNIDIEKAELYVNDSKNGVKISDDLKKIGGINGGYSFGELPVGFYMRSSISNVVWFNNTVRGDATNIEDLTKVEIEIREAMMRTYKYFKANVPGFENAVIIDTAPQVGTRSSRLLDGEYIITRKELMEDTHYADTVVLAQPPYKGFDLSHGLKEIPYRSLLPKNLENLLVAGRCISGDFGAIEMLRVIPTAMLMGQAVGVAAAVAVKDGVSAKQVDVSKVQKLLKQQNVLLP